MLDIGITKVILGAMKTAISIPDPLFDAAERLAHRLGISRSELFQRAVESYLRERRDEGITEALNAVYSTDAKSSSLDPLLHDLQIASLESDDWS